MQFRAIIVSTTVAFAAAQGGGHLWTCPCDPNDSLPALCEGTSPHVQIVQGCVKGLLDTCTKYVDEVNTGCGDSNFMYFKATLDEGGTVLTTVYSDEDCQIEAFSLEGRDLCECSQFFGLVVDHFAYPAFNSCE